MISKIKTKTIFAYFDIIKVQRYFLTKIKLRVFFDSHSKN